ncbi:subtilisin-like protease SBT1.7 [Canna indica]|uniref:Subtilisin-like protease SBT1.7 n=1 Tax=Canna indica TaxID=4628 RepID=A0AAQ3QFQ7_9LILI|nr:subtilisin-like protease SBT1.7 [Canna indica]
MTFNTSSCNNKLIEARTLLSGATVATTVNDKHLASESPIDDDGHGTHTMSTVADMASVAHIAMYKNARRQRRLLAPSENHQGRSGEEEVNSDRSHESEPAATMERLQRSFPAILRLLQYLGRSNFGGADVEREHVVFINPFNQVVIVQASIDANQSQAQAETNGGRGVGVAILGTTSSHRAWTF